MESSRTCASRSEQFAGFEVNVGKTERTISTVAGGVVLQYGLSKSRLATIVAAVAGGVLLYRGLTGHCRAYQLLGMSTSCGLANGKPDTDQMHPLHDVTDASLAATGESPPMHMAIHMDVQHITPEIPRAVEPD